MSSHLPAQGEKAAFYRQVIRACWRSVVRVSLLMALVVVLLKGGGLEGVFIIYILSAVASTLGMGIACVCLLPLIFLRPRLPHPAVISLVTSLVLGVSAYFVAVLLMGGPWLKLVTSQVIFIAVAVVYGVPVGLYLKSPASPLRPPNPHAVS